VIAAARIGFLVIAASCGSLFAASPHLTDAELQKILRTRVDRQKKATGIVIGVIDGQGRRVLSYGTMSLEKQRPVDGKTVFEIGSLTKVFTALLLAEMAQRGEVALDDPVAKYLPADVHVPAPHGRQITLTDLATHTSGLPLRPTNLVSTDPDNKYAGYTSERLDQFVASFVPTHDPGTHYEYSNVGYGLLGQALTRRAQKSFADLVREKITQPLGMKSTGLTTTPEIEQRRATGYTMDLKPAPRWDFGALAAAGGLYSTADDLLDLLAAFLGYEKTPLLPAMNAMLEHSRPGGMEPSSAIALAWNILSKDGRTIAWKNGSVGGFRTFIGYDASSQIGVVALANAQTALGVDDIGLHLLDPAAPVDLSVPKPHHEIALDLKILDRYLGRYRYSPSDQIAVSREGGRLFVTMSTGDKLELFAEGKHDFFFKIADAQITFTGPPDEPARAAIWHQGGQDQRGERVPQENPSASPLP
jgi:D-alanyl-D-alanine-carboxypeptidase/D-alanyl-D-alanine-endopeptidase